MKLSYHDIEVGLDFEPEPGLADNGDLETDLTMPLEQVKFLHFHFRRFDAVVPRGSFLFYFRLACLTSFTSIRREASISFLKVILGTFSPSSCGGIFEGKVKIQIEETE